MCTHLVYSHVRLDDNLGVVPSDPEGDAISFKRFTALRATYPKVKFMVSIAKKSGSYWTKLSKDPEARLKLINGIIEFLRTHDFDGWELDIHLFNFGKDQKFFDKGSYKTFIEEIRGAIDKETIVSGKEKLLYAVLIPEMFNFNFEVDFFNHLVDWFTITEHVSEPTETPLLQHISALYSKTSSSVNQSIEYYLAHGASKDKISMAIPFFGNTFKLKDPTMHQLNSETLGAGQAGKWTLVTGNMAYFEICRLIKDEGYAKVVDELMEHGPYAHKDDNWVSFDDAEMVTKKAEYAAKLGLGGISLLSLDFDDFQGSCGPKFPLTTAASQTFLKI